jgi:hypothetical protein
MFVFPISKAPASTSFSTTGALASGVYVYAGQPALVGNPW